MKSKKIVLIVTMVLIILIAAAGSVAALYFFTDTFKTNDQLFVKYASQIFDLKGILEVENLKEQEQFKNSSTHTSTGNLSINIENGDKAQNVNLATKSQYDINTKRTFMEATVKNGDADLTKISFINSADVYAVKCADVYEYYIGIRNSNLKEFARNMMVEEEIINQIPDTISIDEILNNAKVENPITQEDEEYLKNTYYPIIANQITIDKYTKTEKMALSIDGNNYEAEGYTLTIEETDFKTILTNILNKAKEDETTIQIINKILSTYIPQEQMQQVNIQNVIDNLITSIEEQAMESIKVTAYQSNGKLIRMEILNLEGTSGLVLDMVANTDIQKNINITIKQDGQEIQFSIRKTVLDSGINYSVGIQENVNGYSLEISTTTGNVINGQIYNTSDFIMTDGDLTISASYEKTTQAVDGTIEIQELKNSNTVIANNYPLEQFSPFINGIFEKYGEVFNSVASNLNLDIQNEKNLSNYLYAIAGGVMTAINANVANPYIEIGEATGISIVRSMYSALSNVFEQVQSQNQSFEEQINQGI